MFVGMIVRGMIYHEALHCLRWQQKYDGFLKLFNFVYSFINGAAIVHI